MEDDRLLPGEDGIPLLTNNINPDDYDMNKAAHDRLLNTPAPELVARLLKSESLRQRLDEIAARMTVNARQDLEAAIRPAIEEAITQALNSSGDNIYLAIGKQLENALPDILPHLLQAIDTGEN